MTVSGTRRVGTSGPRLTGLFDDYLRPFTTAGTHVYLGGAAGVDTAALDWLAENTGVSLTVVVPCAVADQPAVAADAIRRWTSRDRLARVVELRASMLATAAYHARNRWMVDRSDLVIGFPRGTDPTSGTRYTLNYAAEQAKPRLVVPI